MANVRVYIVSMVKEDEMINAEKAKQTWKSAGLNAQGEAAVHAWIDQLAANINANPGRWGAYESMAYCTADVMGSVQVLKSAVDQTSK